MLIEKSSSDSLTESVHSDSRIQWRFISKNPNGDFRGLHKQARCKDYANDIVIANFVEDGDQLFPVYGMHYNVDKDPLDKDMTRVGFTGGSDYINNICNNLDIFENIHNTSDKVEDSVVFSRLDENTLIVEADKWWQSSPLHISFFLVFIRALSLYDVEDGESKSIADVFKEEETLTWFFRIPIPPSEVVAGFDKIMDGWSTSIRFLGNTMVHDCGISSMFSGVSKIISGKSLEHMPYFYKVYTNALDNVKGFIEEYQLSNVFVYGTLKSGFCNHSVLGRNRIPIWKGRESLPFRMVDLGAFPGVIKSDVNMYIQGEIYVVSKDGMKGLDRLEGYPTFYNREEHSSQFSGEKVYIYYLPQKEYENYPSVIDGDWSIK